MCGPSGFSPTNGNSWEPHSCNMDCDCGFVQIAHTHKQEWNYNFFSGAIKGLVNVSPICCCCVYFPSVLHTLCAPERCEVSVLLWPNWVVDFCALAVLKKRLCDEHSHKYSPFTKPARSATHSGSKVQNLEVLYTFSVTLKGTQGKCS